MDAVVTLGSTTPADGATDVLVGDPLAVAWTVGKGSYDSATGTLTCDGAGVAGAFDAISTGGTFTPGGDLPKGASCTWQGSVTAKGENGGKAATKNWNVTFQTEAPVVVNLDPYDTVIGVRYGVVGLITKTAPFWKDAENQTSYQTGAIPLGNCMVSEEPLPNGYFLEVCWAASDLIPHIIQHNPITNVVTDFVGTAPAGYEVTLVGTKWTFGPKWHGTSWGVAPYSYMLRWAGDASGGYFYADVVDDRILSYRSATGIQSVLYTSSDGGAFKVMVRVQHPKVHHYTDQVYVIQTGNYIFSATTTGVTALVNKTQYHLGDTPLANCWLPKPGSGVLSDGTILAACQDAISLRRHYLYIHPVEQAVYEYTGPVPAVLACTENANLTWTCPPNHEWVAVQPVRPTGLPGIPDADVGVAVHVSDGWYWSPTADSYDIRFVTNGGVDTLIKDGVADDGVVKHMETYSH